jgi:lysylphosphatidylglycerol synthetase-like protein (DUF2156 family)
MSESTVIDDLSLREGTSQQLSQKAINSLARTAGWIKLAAVLGFSLVLLSLGMMLFNLNTLSRFNSSLDYSHAITLISSLVGLVSSWFLLSYANKLKLFVADRRAFDLRQAFYNQKIYYTINGVLIIIYLSLFVIALCALPFILPKFH